MMVYLYNYYVLGHNLSSCFFYLKQHFRGWILSPSSGKNLLSWTQSIQLVPVSGEDGERIQSPKHSFKLKRKNRMDNVQKHNNCTNYVKLEANAEKIKAIAKPHTFLLPGRTGLPMFFTEPPKD
jgi:hypothetical protein